MTEQELLHKIASIIDTTHRTSFALPIYDIANQILDIPEIKEALEYMKLIRSGRIYDIEIKMKEDV